MSATESKAVLKPQPRVNDVTRPFWDGASGGTLMIQRCSTCRRAIFYPRVCCPFCKAPDPSWERASGRGRIISHTTVRRTHHDGFNEDAPYVFAAIGLDEGPCIYAQVPGAPLEGSLVGRAVEVGFVEHGPGRKMPVFRMAA
jgi:uncharacterized OB-fold protein